jgi:5-methylcytosine-specific restriction endonuclease McrA
MLKGVFFWKDRVRMSSQCVVLNGDYSFLCLVDWRKAMCLVIAEKVKVLKYTDRVIHGVGKVFRAPAILVLIKVVRSVYRAKVPFSKRNILARDGYRCVYCGKKGKPLTIDHVIPRSKGGNTDWENCVACCTSCNHKKEARTPTEAKMHLSRRPFQPTISEFMRIRLKQSGVYEFLVELGLYL